MKPNIPTCGQSFDTVYLTELTYKTSDHEDIFWIVYNHFKKIKDLESYLWSTEVSGSCCDSTEKWEDLECDVDAEWSALGASKVVFSFSDLPDYVVKIPLRGKRVYHYEYDEETEEYGDIIWDEYDEYEFCNAPKYDPTNYCEAEAAFYLDACAYNVEKAFAMTTYLGKIHGIPFYISEKVVNPFNYRDRNEPSAADSNTAKKIKAGKSLLTGLSITYLPYVIMNYGEEFARKLDNFISTFGITDIHAGNVGFTEDGVFKIIDYSCYND